MGGGGWEVRCQTFSFFFFSFLLLFLSSSFPCSADHDERDWPPCKVVFFRLATNTLNVGNNNNNESLVYTQFDFTVDEGKKWVNPSREKN